MAAFQCKCFSRFERSQGLHHLWADCLQSARPVDRVHLIRPSAASFGCQHCCQQFLLVETVIASQLLNAELIENLSRQIVELEAQIPHTQLIIPRPYIWMGERWNH